MSSIKTAAFPVKRARPIIRGPFRAFWPVVLATSVAIVLVGAGLTVAVQSITRPASTEIDLPPIAEVPPAAEEFPWGPPIQPATEKQGKPAVAEKPPEVAPPKQIVVEKPLANVAKPKKTVEPPTAKAEPETMVEELVLGKPAPIEAQAEPKACGKYGTAIDFLRTPALAARTAIAEDRLVLLLHVSGNFEDPGFT